MPFSVIVSRIAATPLEIMNVCLSTSGEGGEFNELHTVLFDCVLPSYNSIDAVFFYCVNLRCISRVGKKSCFHFFFGCGFIDVYMGREEKLNESLMNCTRVISAVYS